MIYRVTENMKYNTLTGSLFNVQGKAAELMEKISTQKNINRPSDDPMGTGKVLNYTSTQASIKQYQTNITNAQGWLSLTETNLSGIKDIIAQAKDIATQSGTEDSNETMDTAASVLNSMIDNALSLMNAKSGNSYLFGGSRTDVAPFSSTPLGRIGDVTVAPVNNFDGIVASGGTYTGTTNKTYLVKIINGGTADVPLAAATYKISTDGGATWGAVQNFPPQTLEGSTAQLAGGLPITAGTVWNTIDGANVQDGTTIQITGIDHAGSLVPRVGSDLFTIDDAGTGTVQDLLDQIEATMGGEGNPVTASIDAMGRITVTDNTTGESQLAMTLTVANGIGGTLDLGTYAASTTSSILIGDGINMTFTAGAHTLSADDSFAVNATAATIGPANAILTGTFNGTAVSGGIYTGAESKTYSVKIVNGGTADAPLAAATYKISTDGGATWGAVQNFPPQTLEGSTVQLAGGLPITAGTIWNTIDGANVQDGTTIQITGIDHAGNPVSDLFTIGDAGTGTVQDLLDQIEATMGGGGNPVTASIDTMGRITVTDNTTGDSQLAMTLTVTNVGIGTLDLGTYAASTTSSITVGDGINMTFTAGSNNLVADDLFTINGGAAGIGSPAAVPVNTFDGTVTSTGNYTGMVNKTYVLKIIEGGALADATYQVSTDGGITWGDTETGLSSTVTLGEGINLTFTAGTHDLVADDAFTISAIATSIDAASAATTNDFNGTVTSGGVYTGTRNKSYALKVITGGTLNGATYEISADGGKTWAAVQNFSPQEVKGQVANTAWSSPITAATTWKEIDGANVQDNTTISISGTNHDGIAVGGLPADTFTITNAATGTVQDLLDGIEASFGGTVTASIDMAGKITVTDNATGDSQLALTLAVTNPPGSSLAFGAVDATTTKTIDLGDGTTMTFTPNNVDLAANDLFTVNSYTGGYYRGNDDQLTMQVGKGNNFAYNITGYDAFTASNVPVASASITNAGNLTEDTAITLTRGEGVGSWTLTSNTQYPDMKIISSSATEVKIATDGNTADITLALSGAWAANDKASFTVSAPESTPPTVPTLSAVTVSGPGTVDLLKTLNTLKTALEAHDTTAIAVQADNLSIAETQVLQALTEAGAKASSLTTTSTSLTTLNERITSLKSGIEDADLSKLIISYQMEMTALQASYNMAAKISQMTILDYI